MLHNVKLLERRFPRLGDRIVAYLLALSTLLLVIGLAIQFL
jgi:hypothetical protein